MSKKKPIPSLYLLKIAEEFILKESRAWTPRETGGILIGKVQSADVLVTQALGPGPKAHHDTNNFKRDGEYSQKELERIFSLTKGEENYVGEWHSHPVRCQASSKDVGSIEWISKNIRYDCESPVLIISTPSKGGSWNLIAYRWTGKRLIRQPIAIGRAEELSAD